MNNDKLHFYDDGIERMVTGDPFGSTQVPSLGIGLHVKPKFPIHIVVGRDEFTDTDIREWAEGNLKSIDWAAGQWTFLIEYLSQIIVSQILDKEPSACNF